ncbi:MAG: hypothetical protein JWQ98_3255 [Chlorobi bacterium]|nr:hypothetical protein [Chlorobiota bacterium]
MKTLSITPQSICRSFLPILLLAGCALIVAACSTAKRYDDAVRITPAKEGRYNRAPNTTTLRDGRTLRGMVKEIRITNHRDKEGKIDTTGRLDTTFVFVATGAEDRKQNYEMIPYADIEPVDSAFDMVEFWNPVIGSPDIRKVPVKTYIVPAGGGTGDGKQPDCGCQPLSVEFELPEITCPDRRYQFYFAELRAVYGAYRDKQSQEIIIGKDAIFGEAALGLRFGAADEWGIGVAYTSGLPAFNSTDGTLHQHPAVLLHARYQTPGPVTNVLGFCMKPFIYGDIGGSVDDVTINLFKFNFSSKTTCEKCGESITQLAASGQLGDVDLSVPITYGLGIGVDFPIASFMDLSADAGWRSASFGETANLGGIILPSQRRLNAFYFRLGLTF